MWVDDEPTSAKSEATARSDAFADAPSTRIPARAAKQRIGAARDKSRRGRRDEEYASDDVSDSDSDDNAGVSSRSRRSQRRRGNAGQDLAKAGGIAIGILLALLLVGGGGYAAYQLVFRSSCEIPRVEALIASSADAAALHLAGSGCVEKGIAEGLGDSLATGIRALRRASDLGSEKAGNELGRIFDPLVRPDVEKEAATIALLPRADEAIAARYYDAAAAAGNGDARDNVARLRTKYPDLPGADGVQLGKNGRPLGISGHPGLYQRVLAKPDAVLQASPDANASGTPLRIFDLLYVFERRPGWLKVGHLLQTGAEGWVANDKAQEWRAMLAMKYLPQGSRNPALFFRDDVTIRELLTAPGASERVRQIVASAQRGSPDSSLVAIEDQSIDWASSQYVMPILDADKLVADDGRTVYLAKVASIAIPGTRGAPSYCKDTDRRLLTNDVVFVIDTTSSMGPYIEGVKRIAREWQRQIESRGLTDQFRFGVVAYRNNMDAEPQASGLEYVTNPVLPLSATSDVASFVAAVEKLSPARVSTHSFSEDAVAGLDEALKFNWSGCGPPAIFLVTDAGALAANDPKARLGGSGDGLVTMAQEARNKNIVIYPVHIQTPEARQAGNVDGAAAQYRDELATGTNYKTIRDGSPAAFSAYLSGIGQQIDAVAAAKRGDMVAKPSGDPSGLGGKRLTELFAAQQRFIGAMAGATAPIFAETWTSDIDLGAPDRHVLEVAVLLTRRQLSELAAQTEYLLRAANSQQTESSTFFNLLQMVSAATAQDPRRFGGDSARMGAMLPAFLGLLPYRSEVLELTAKDWRDMQAQKQTTFINKLQQKLQGYRRTEADRRQWVALGSSDDGEAMALVRLEDLP